MDSLEFILSKQIEPPLLMEATNVKGSEPYIFLDYYIRPVYFEGLPYRDGCTLVFGWLSTPLHKKDQPVPGAVLLHGGGFTALRRWCEQWARNDIASFAIGLEGQTDESYGEFWGQHWQKTPLPGPYRTSAVYVDSNLPTNEQWMFHAVAQSILANTILRAQNSVDPNLVGVAGVSWGGVLAATMMTLDYERLAFVIPGYGCGNMAGDGGSIGRQIFRGGMQYYSDVWDPTVRLERLLSNDIKIPPSLWISWPQEKHFPIERQAITYQTLLKYGAHAMILLIPDLGHSHVYVFRRPENYYFVKSIMESRAEKVLDFSSTETKLPDSEIKGEPFVMQLGKRKSQDKTSQGDMLLHTFVFLSKIDFIDAEVVYSCGDIFSAALHKHYWESKPVQKLDKEGCPSTTDGTCLWSVTVKIPIFNSCAWYVNLTTENGLVVSSTLDINNKQKDVHT